MKRTIVAFALAAVIAPPLPAAEPAGKWFHMIVAEQDGGRTRIRLNLPLSAVTRAAHLFPDDRTRSKRIELGGADFRVSDFRRIWTALPEAAETTLPDTVHEVKLKRERGYLIISVANPADPAVVRIPAAVVDALLSGAGNDLDFAAAARVVARIAPSEVLAVATDEKSVRMWVDSNPGGE